MLIVCANADAYSARRVTRIAREHRTRSFIAIVVGLRCASHATINTRWDLARQARVDTYPKALELAMGIAACVKGHREYGANSTTYAAMGYTTTGLRSTMMLRPRDAVIRTIMGYSITWCAVREEAAQSLLQKSALSATGKLEEVPESPISTTRLDTGWRIVWYNGYECPFLRAQDLHDLSKDEDVLLCRVEEHVMASSCEMWSRGTRRWCVSHEGEDGPKGLSTEGALPELFPRIRQEMEEAQRAAGGDDAEVDYIFEIPLRLAEQLVGFKHDEDYAHLVDGHFAVLSRDGSSESRGIFRRLFGK